MIKKLLALLLTVIIATPIIGELFDIKTSVKAEGNYSVSCNAYEVSYINDDGSFSKVDCYNTFNEAKARMKTNTDYVVRHDASLSPSKIIAMNSGFAYTYPCRNGDSPLTMNLWSTANKRNGKTTYLPNHYEMTYIDTVEIIGSNPGTGMIHIVMNDFDGYTDLEYTDLVPMKFIKNHLPIYLGGNDASSQGEQPFKVYPMQNFYYVDNGDLVFSYYRSYSSCGGDAENTRLRIGAAPSFMSQGKNYYSNDGINFYNDRDLTSYAGTNYNYYQFLPLRSKSSITGGELDAYLNSIVSNSAMKGHGQDFVDAQNNYGVNALLLYAMALHESGNGNSKLAWEYNNLFGWSAYDSHVEGAKHYGSISECVAAQAGDNLANYMDIADWRFFGSFLGDRGSGFNVKYASDPYWGLKIAATAYRIDKSVGLRDYSNYSLALVTQMDAPVKQYANSGSKTYYTTGYGDNYQKNYIAIALNQENGYTKIQSTNPIDNGNLVTPSTLPSGTLAKYNFGESVGFVNNSQIQYLNGTKPVVIGDYVHGDEKISLADGVLSISGKAYRENLTASGSNVSTTLTFIKNNGTSKTVNLTSTLKDDVITYSGDINVAGLDAGMYRLRINTTYSGYNYNDSYTLSLEDIYLNNENNKKLISTGNKDGDFVLNITDINNDNYYVDRYISNLTFDKDNGLYIEGLAAIKGINMPDDTRVKHQVVIRNLETNEDTVIDATNTQQTYSLSNGLSCGSSGFKASIPLSKLTKGNYAILIKIIVDDKYVATRDLSVLDLKQCTSFKGDNGLTYTIKANELYAYRAELMVEALPEEIDYSSISKPVDRQSLECLDGLSIDDNGNAEIDAAAMVYYLNYDENNKPTYKIHLIADDGTSKEIDAETKLCTIPFQKYLKSSYNMDYIYLVAKFNLVDLDLDFGNYQILVELNQTNGGKNYKDYIELSDIDEFISLPSKKIGNKKFSFKLSNVRDRIYLEVKKVNE